MPIGFRCRTLDLGFVATLLGIGAVPLLLLRGSPLLTRPGFLLALALTITALVAVWASMSRHWETDSRPTGEEDQPDRWRTLLIAILLAALTVVNFFGPLRIGFWSGTDDWFSFQQQSVFQWMGQWDQGMNRPLTGLPCLAGQALTPERIEGFLFLAVGLCWANGMLLFALLRQLTPGSRLLPFAAAVLLITDRSEPSRFLVLWTSNFYWTALGLLLLAGWLFLWSYRRGSRPLLVLGCLALAAALTMNEGAFPLAVLAPVLARLLGKHRHRLPVWTAAWGGVLAVLAVRFLLYLGNRGTDSYQAKQSAELFHQPRALLKNLRLHLGAGFDNFQVSGALVDHWRSAVAALALVVLLGCLAVWRTTPREPSRRQYLLGLGVAALALLLGSAPFVHIPEIFRTQFFSAPGQACLLACAFGLLGSYLGHRLGSAVVIGAVALVVANGTAEAITGQEQRRAQTPVHFDLAVHVFRQIHAVCPDPAPDTLMLLFLEKPGFAPFKCNLCCLQVSRRVLGAHLVQANYEDGLGNVVEFRPDVVSVKKFPADAPYNKLLAFRLGTDGTVTFLDRLPTRYLPSGVGADRYQPLAQIQPGPVGELPFLQYPFRGKKPADLFDMADGILLGRGWGHLEAWEGKLSRQVAGAAELVVNPLNQGQRTLRLEVASEQAGRLEVLDSRGKVVAGKSLGGREMVVLTVPTNPNQVSLFRLRFTDAQGTPGGFRVFCQQGKEFGSRQWGPPPPDVITDDLELGANWHGLETSNGKRYRWVANDAEILLGSTPGGPRSLVLDLEPGPGLGGEPCHLTLQDQLGNELAAVCVYHRQEARLALPPDTQAGTIFKIHVRGGGLPHPTDSRIMNFRVFRCTLSAD